MPCIQLQYPGRITLTTNSPTHGNPLLGNFQSKGFWNPTHIRPNERDALVHRMDLNECPYPPSPKVIEAIAQAAAELNRYPDGTCPVLTPHLAEALGVEEELICYGAGSTQLLTSIAQICISTGNQLVAPGLIWRRFAGVFDVVGAEPRLVDNHPDGRIDVDGLIAAIGNDTRLMVVLSPNNPTGMMLTQAELESLRDGVPDNVLLFVDEAYFEFSQFAGGPDAVEILKSRRGPWVVTRTFSKAYALAGLRLGYAVCSSTEITNALRLVTSTFNVTGVAEAAVVAALEDESHTHMILETTRIERERLSEGLRAMGLEVMDSVTNFVGVDVGRDATPVVREMRDLSVRVATFGYESNATHLRISTGLPEDTDACLTALAQVLAT
jgi:histidinol-phosphate aminotransferase